MLGDAPMVLGCSDRIQEGFKGVDDYDHIANHPESVGIRLLSILNTKDWKVLKDLGPNPYNIVLALGTPFTLSTAETLVLKELGFARDPLCLLLELTLSEQI